jgi:opacity protein-like surface antigen
MNRALRLTAALVLAAVASLAFADPPEPTGRNYVLARLGVYLPQNDDFTWNWRSEGPGIDVVYGRRLNAFLAGELGIGWYASGTDVFAFQDGTARDLSVALVPVTASARVSLPLGRIEPYALAGVGLYVARLRESLFVEEFGSSFGDHLSAAFGVQAGGGAALRLTQKASVGLEGRYFYAADPVLGDEARPDLRGFLVNASLAFRF